MARNKVKFSIPGFLFWIIWIFGFLSYAPQHVSWRDEYQSWLVSTRTETWPEFFEAVRYERHPPLHYLLQRGVFKALSAVEPERRQEFLSSEMLMRSVTEIFSILNVGIILLFFPAGILIRIVLSLGIPFVLEYGLISRTYAIGAFFLFASALACLRGRNKTEALFWSLASLTHLYFTLIIGGLILSRLWPFRSVREFKLQYQRQPSLIFVSAVVWISLFLQRPPPDSVFTGALNPLKFNPLIILTHFGWGITGLDHFSGPFEWNAHPEWIGLLGFLVLYGLWRKRWHSSFPVNEFFTVVTPCLLLMNLAYAPYARHALLLWVVVVYFVLRSSSRPPLFRVCALLMCFATYRFLGEWKPWDATTAFDFSGQRELKRAIAPQLQNPLSILVVENEDIYFPVMGSLGIDVFSAKRERILQYTYFKGSEWKSNLQRWCDNGGATLLRKRYPNIFFGLELGKPLPSSCGESRLIFETKRNIVFDEKYQVYQLL